ncbi:MAG: hypothetical protein Q4Q06_08160 [Bacteroidota bacterium]|nr:hypothetical protein [Bacteroidota bacterium]
MKKLFLILGVVVLMFCSCNKNNLLEGTYICDNEASDLEFFVENSPVGGAAVLISVLSKLSKDGTISTKDLFSSKDTVLDSNSSVNNVKDMILFEKMVIADTNIILYMHGDTDTATYSVITDNNSTKIIIKDEDNKPLDTMSYDKEKQILNWQGLVFKRK